MAHLNEEYQSKDAEQALAHVIEECGEVISAAGKTLRFGPMSADPTLPPEEQTTNIEWLIMEMEDLQRSIDIFLKFLE